MNTNIFYIALNIYLFFILVYYIVKKNSFDLFDQRFMYIMHLLNT